MKTKLLNEQLGEIGEQLHTQDNRITSHPIFVVEKKDLIMKADDYQVLASRTLIDAPDFEIPDDEIMIVWNAIGLAGEAGEVAELAKKGVFHQHGVNCDKFAKELGDCLWYIAAICTNLNLSMSEIMASNIEKLKQRYPNGYSSADSKNRVDIS